MARVQLIKTAAGYLPHSAHDEAELESVRLGDVVEAQIRKVRNPNHHRKAFALLHDLFDNQDTFDSFDTFYTWAKIKCGLVETFIDSDGKVYYTPESLAFSSMDQLRFDSVYQKFITLGVEMGQDWVLLQYA